MRKLLLPITLFLFLSSCDDSHQSYYHIKNNSTHNITLYSYAHYETINIIDTLFLLQGEDSCRTLHRMGDKPPLLHDLPYFFNSHGVSDSAKIYFDTSKVLNFYSTDSSKENNILSVKQSFKREDCQNDNCNYIYEITDEDYERAEWIKK